MKKNILLAAVLTSTSFVSAFAAQAAPEGIDINKINQVIEDAKNKVLPEFSEYIQEANVTIDPVTFDLEKAAIDVTFAAGLKKTIWSEKPSTIKFGVGTKVHGYRGKDKLVANLGGGLHTQMLSLTQYLANKALAQDTDPDNDSATEVVARSYVKDLLAASSFETIVDRTLVLRDTVLAAQDPSFDEAKEFLKGVKLSKVNGGLNLVTKAYEFYGVSISATVVATDSTFDFSVKVVDISNNFIANYAELKDSIKQSLLEVQKGSAEIRTELETGVRTFFHYTKPVVTGED